MSLLALAAIVAGCRDFGRMDTDTALVRNDPEQRHAISFSERSSAMLVEVPSGGPGLSPDQEIDVHRFIARYKSEGMGRLKVSSAATPRDGAATQRSLAGIRALIQEAGISPRAIEVSRHRSGAGPSQGVRLSYERPVAVPPVCQEWNEDLGPNHERVHFPNFGCSTQHNIAVMVANPRDLIEPQPEDPRLGERRGATWAEYTKQSGSASPAGGAAAAQSSPDAKAAPVAAKK